MQERVSVSKEEYAYLLENSFKYGVLLDTIYQSEDTVFGEYISINVSQVNRILKIIDQQRYEKNLNKIKEKEND